MPDPQFRDAKLLAEESGVSVRAIGQFCRYGYLTHIRPSKRTLLVSVADFQAHLASTAVRKTR